MEHQQNDNLEHKATDPRYLLRPFQYAIPPAEQDHYYNTPTNAPPNTINNPPNAQPLVYDSFGLSSVSVQDLDSHHYYADLYVDIERLVGTINASETIGIESQALLLDLRRSSEATQRIYGALTAQQEEPVASTRNMIINLQSVVTGESPFVCARSIQ